MKSIILAAALMAFAGAAAAQQCGGFKEADAPIVKPAPTT